MSGSRRSAPPRTRRSNPEPGQRSDAAPVRGSRTPGAAWTGLGAAVPAGAGTAGRDRSCSAAVPSADTRPDSGRGPATRSRQPVLRSPRRPWRPAVPPVGRWCATVVRPLPDRVIDSTPRPATRPAKETRPGAAARTGAPVAVARSTPRWPRPYAKSGGCQPLRTIGREPTGQARPPVTGPGTSGVPGTSADGPPGPASPGVADAPGRDVSLARHPARPHPRQVMICPPERRPPERHRRGS